jgi:hypothetical protein
MKEETINLLNINSLSEYMEAVANIGRNEQDSVWFRGHAYASYRLTPTALRDTIPYRGSRGELLSGSEYRVGSGDIVTGISPERMLDDFKRKARPFVDRDLKNDFEWLFLMQHHGVPTRLLDWTTNALVALYFAVSSLNASILIPKEATENDEGSYIDPEFPPDAAAVFAVNPEKLNEALHPFIKSPIDVAEHYEAWQHYVRPMEGDTNTYAPICITAPQISPRIRAQSGLFTLHGSNIHAIDYYTVCRPLITKLLIPHSVALSIQAELHRFGITESFIFPDLDGVAREIRAEENRAFAWRRKNHLEKLASKA